MEAGRPPLRAGRSEPARPPITATTTWAGSPALDGCGGAGAGTPRQRSDPRPRPHGGHPRQHGRGRAGRRRAGPAAAGQRRRPAPAEAGSRRHAAVPTSRPSAIPASPNRSAATLGGARSREPRAVPGARPQPHAGRPGRAGGGRGPRRGARAARHHRPEDAPIRSAATSSPTSRTSCGRRSPPSRATPRPCSTIPTTRRRGSGSWTSSTATRRAWSGW